MNAFTNSAKNTKRSKERRRTALERQEFREPSVPREPATGPTSFPVKAVDEPTQRLIDSRRLAIVRGVKSNMTRGCVKG